MNQKRIYCLFAMACLAACITIVSCTELTGVSQDGDATGTLRVLVTDKPFPFDFIDEALVTITRVEVRLDDDDDDGGDDDDGDDDGDDEEEDGDDDGEDGDDEEEDGDGDGEEDGDDDDAFIVIFEGERVFNLIDLQNGRTDMLADAVVPAGTYTQMRLIVTAGEVTLTDGRTFPLSVPSGAQSGIKLHFTFEVAEGDEPTTLLLDVDLSKAFNAIPGGHIEDVDSISNFQFRPSVAMRLINLVDAGSIAGTVTGDAEAPLEAVSVTAFNGDTDVTSSATEADGSYVLSGLPVGTYRVEFSKEGYDDVEIADVEVAAGETTADVNVQMTPIGSPE